MTGLDVFEGLEVVEVRGGRVFLRSSSGEMFVLDSSVMTGPTWPVVLMVFLVLVLAVCGLGVAW